MNFTLTRQSCGLYGVFGELVSEDGSKKFVTLEHAFIVNKQYMPKVAAGVYTCQRYYSPKHRYDLFLVKNVPPFQGAFVTYIELHIGNYNTDSDGCILLGLAKGTGMIEDSRDAFWEFMELQKDVENFTLTIV
jgi:hypothetical protein